MLITWITKASQMNMEIERKRKREREREREKERERERGGKVQMKNEKKQAIVV